MGAVSFELLMSFSMTRAQQTGLLQIANKLPKESKVIQALSIAAFLFIFPSSYRTRNKYIHFLILKKCFLAIC